MYVALNENLELCFFKKLHCTVTVHPGMNRVEPTCVPGCFKMLNATGAHRDRHKQPG